jgi:hypothetical protein
MDYPKTLTPADWDKTMGPLAKTHPTGIGDALKTLQKQYDAIDWSHLDPSHWLKNKPSAEAFEETWRDQVKALQPKLAALKTQADKVESLADKWAATFSKDKQVPKEATRAAKQVADAADRWCKGIKPWLEQQDKQAAALLAKLPKPDDDEPEDKLLSPDLLKSVLLRCRNRPGLPAQFAYCPPGKGDALLVAHFKIPAKRLLAKAREATGASQGYYGTLQVEDGQLLLSINKVPGGLVKQIQALTKAAGLHFSAIKVVDA